MGSATEAGVSPVLSWMTAGSLVTLPIAVVELSGPYTDLPAAAWLACAAALLVAACVRPIARARDPSVAASAVSEQLGAEESRSRLLAVAVLAAGLGVGSKPTVAPLAALALAIGGWRLRHELRALVAPLILAVAVATVTGGIWFIRNLIDHGAPLWPVSSTPWGDPIPPPIRAIHDSFLSHVSAMLDGRIGAYTRVLAGGVILLGAALVSPLWARRRVAGWAALIVVAALLIWAASPTTGISFDTALAVGATRFLLPGLLTAAGTVALAGRGEPGPRPGSTRAQAASLAALAVALAINLDRDAALPFPDVASGRSLLLPAAVGAAVALAAGWLVKAPAVAARTQHVRRIAPLLGLAVVAAAVAALMLPVAGYLAGHAGAGLGDAGLVRWLDSRAAFRVGHEPVLIGPVTVAVLTGARLAHPLVLIRASDRCPQLAYRARSSWVVIENVPEDSIVEHIKDSQLERGTNEDRAEEIAARTVNKERARSGESETASRTSTQDMSSSRRGGQRSGTSRAKGRTRDQLYNEARQLGIDGRSGMNKAQLEREVENRRD